jgi:hypothetical protein
VRSEPPDTQPHTNTTSTHTQTHINKLSVCNCHQLPSVAVQGAHGDPNPHLNITIGGWGRGAKTPPSTH